MGIQGIYCVPFKHHILSTPGRLYICMCVCIHTSMHSLGECGHYVLLRE